MQVYVVDLHVKRPPTFVYSAGIAMGYSLATVWQASGCGETNLHCTCTHTTVEPQYNGHSVRQPPCYYSHLHVHVVQALNDIIPWL